MERNASGQELRRISLAITCRWISVSFALYTIGTIAKIFSESTFVPSDSRTWLPLLESFLSWGAIPLLAVCLSQLACYYWPEDTSISNLERITARLAIGASVGYLLMAPMLVSSCISLGDASPGATVTLINCFRCFALSLGFIGASRTRNLRESPFLTNSTKSPLDYWLEGKFNKYK